MLEAAGFKNSTVTGDYTDEAATTDHEDLIFIAVK